MAFSSVRFSPPSLQPHSLSQRLPQLRAEVSLSISCSLTPLRPHSRRKNHLRTKIPNFPPPLPQLPEHIDSSADGSGLLILKEMEEAKDSFTSYDVSNVLAPGDDHGLFPGPVLALAARFAVLLAVQTAVALWFLSRADVEEAGRGSNEIAFKEDEKVAGVEKEMVAEDFERAVAEIRMMASAVREREAEGNLGGGVEEDERESTGEGRCKKSTARIFMGGQGDGLVPKKKSSKLKLRDGGVGYFPKGKGFGGSKQIRSGSGLGKGGIQQISYLNSVKESTELCVPKQSDARTYNVDQISSKNENIETEIKIEASKCTSENSMGNNSIKNGVDDSQSNPESSMILTTRHDRDEESVPASHGSQWWLMLPYVFGILLHKGSENGDKGLYSLRMSSKAHDGEEHSYTITFQDRGDAMNFSFLLESFFEDLGNVRADIVPLTIHELDDAVRSGEMKLIVARKGQLCLYAGQPLVEVENTLRSLLE